MKFAKIINNIIIQVQTNKQNGFVEVNDDVVCGMMDNGDGAFSNPVKSQTQINQDRISEIDLRLSEIDKLSLRSLRSKSLGRGNAQDDSTLTQLDDDAELLRTERGTLV